MSVPKGITNNYPELSTRCILAGYRGSISHGTYTSPKDPTSIDDKDVMYVCVPAIDYYFGYPLGFGNNKIFPINGTREIKYNEWDIVVYESKKFISMLAQGNPNVLALLWLEPNLYITKTYPGELILEKRKLFIGRHTYRSFTGYAYSQLHRMTHNAFEGHMGIKRKQLVEKFGYDCKNASHLIRLLRMGIEFLKDGELYVMREDASQLLEIKNGEWTLEQVKSEADRLFISAEYAYQNSKLPTKPNYIEINKLSIDVINLSMELFGT